MRISSNRGRQHLAHAHWALDMVPYKMYGAIP